MAFQSTSEMYKGVYKHLRKAGYNQKESYDWIIKHLPTCNKNSTVGKCMRELVRESSKERRIY